MKTAYPFEMRFRDTRKLVTFVKMCESLFVHSDTALFKVKKKGLYVNVTDFESMCSVEGRVLKSADDYWTVSDEEFTSKILLDSLISELKRAIRNKQVVTMRGEHPHILKIVASYPKQFHQRSSGINKRIHEHSQQNCSEKVVVSTEHRIRVFHIVSRRSFISKSGNYASFRIVNSEFNKIITMKAIVSGVSGGVASISILPTNSTECKLIFYVKSNSGTTGKLTISTSCNSTDEVKMLNVPKESIDMQYLLSYIKRSQNMMAAPADFTTVYVSNEGVMLETELKDNISMLLFTTSLEGIDLDSYS
jgi:hypothetical protein